MDNEEKDKTELDNLPEEEQQSSTDNTSDSESSSSDETEKPTSENEQRDEVKADSPVDALSKTPEELEAEQAELEKENPETVPAEKPLPPIKKFFRKANIYLLAFIFLVVVAGAITAVYYINETNEEPEAAIGTQELTADALRQLANNDASIGSSSQTLTIQGNAIISGQTLMRGDLNVAGAIQSGESIQGSSITISGSANLGETQADSLRVANNVAIQGSTTLRDLSVSGASNFSGNVTASQITVTRLILSGNATLEVPNHIRFTGSSPSRTVNSTTLGSGGTVSLNGSDTAGTVNINTGNNPSAGCFTQITFNQPFSNQPRVVISPVGAAAGRTQYYVTRSKTGFSICSVNPAPANQSFSFDYFITN